MAPQKTRYKTASPGRKLSNLKGEWTAMREGQLIAIPSVRAESTLLIGSAVLVSLRPGLWPAAVACGLGFPLLYGASVKAVLWVCPGFISSWTSAPPWG